MSPSVFIIESAIDEQTYAQVLAVARTVSFVDGAVTAGRWGSHRKRNAQAKQQEIGLVCDRVMQELLTHRELGRRVLPDQAVQPILNRYGVGDYYGPHEDSPIHSGIRADLSYTLALSDPATYDGGELLLGPEESAMRVKLPACALVCYPSGTPHQVLPVSGGERLAMVGWIQSIVRDPEHRATLFDLRETTDALSDRGDLNEEVARLSRVYGSLLRRWAFA